MPQVALYRPEIPQNTGNIGRLCTGFEVKLNILGEPGFSFDNKYMKRAGLDYWQYLNWQHFSDEHRFLSDHGDKTVCISKFGTESIYEYPFEPDSVLLFGQETTGVPPELTERYALKRIKIPMAGPVRSFNLANSVAIALSEALRKCGIIK